MYTRKCDGCGRNHVLLLGALGFFGVRRDGDTLTGKSFWKSDSVVCEVTPNDGVEDGTTVTSNAVTIDNTPPELASVRLSPTPVYEGTTLSCVPGKTKDVDGDTVKVSYRWLVS